MSYDEHDDKAIECVECTGTIYPDAVSYDGRCEHCQAAEDVEVIARRVIADAVQTAISLGDLWEDYPEIGQHDFERVENRAEELARHPYTMEQYEAAYDRLAKTSGGGVTLTKQEAAEWADALESRHVLRWNPFARDPSAFWFVLDCKFLWGYDGSQIAQIIRQRYQVGVE